MSLNDDSNYYEVLDARPDASPEEIRQAYLRAKATYGRDSVALYSLFDLSETQEVLRRIEEAYLILSHPEKRKAYDLHHSGFAPSTPLAEVFSIDRVPPMEPSAQDDLLVPPATDFGSNHPRPSERAAGLPLSAPGARPETRKPKAPALRPSTPAFSLPQSLEDEIRGETQWRGPFLRRVREAARISLEEMSSCTKIGRNYLLAIEEDDFSRLPAPVFIRGFLIQIAKVLRLPPEQVSRAYTARVTLAKQGKS